MRIRDIEGMYDYATWANRQLVAAVTKLTTEAFIADIAGGHASIRNTLVHMVSAEWGWLDRCGGEKRPSRLDPSAYPTIATVMATWTSVERYMRGLLSSLQDADLEREVAVGFDPRSTHVVQLGHILQHAIVHGAHHRGQVALLTRMQGQAPGNFDLIFFDAERQHAS